MIKSKIFEKEKEDMLELCRIKCMTPEELIIYLSKDLWMVS